MNGVVVGGKEPTGDHKEDIVVVTTVEGGRVDLPCDIKSPTPGDSVYLVLWYRKDTGTSSKESGTPIYRYYDYYLHSLVGYLGCVHLLFKWLGVCQKRSN